MVGQVSLHALGDWDDFADFRPPDIEVSDGMLPIDWQQLQMWREDALREGMFFGVHLSHGHTLLRLQDLRGFENLVYDMLDQDARLWELIRVVETFNLSLVHRFIQLQPDFIGIPEDLGAQDRLLISPALFRKFIKPSYQRLVAPIKRAGILVHEHCDGHIMQIIDDLVEIGVDILNLQDLVNGIDDIAKHLKGRMAIDLDIDRQNITVAGSPKDIDDHIRECVIKLGSPQGGLSLVYHPWPPISMENLRAVFDAMERYCTYYTD
jgi:hypothetical protein